MEIPQTVPRTVPRYAATVAANTPSNKNRPKISLKELAERRHIVKYLNASLSYARSKLAPFPVDIQVETIGDVYQAIIRVKWEPVPPLPEVIYEPKPEGSL